jgi:hypothetical protein
MQKKIILLICLLYALNAYNLKYISIFLTAPIDKTFYTPDNTSYIKIDHISRFSINYHSPYYYGLYFSFRVKQGGANEITDEFYAVVKTY